MRVTGRRRRTVASVAVGALAVAGIAAFTAAIVSQRQPPRPAQVARGSNEPYPVTVAIPVPGSHVDDARKRPPTDPVRKVRGPVLSASKPLALDIPAIGVRSTLQYLGLTAEHTLQVPTPGPRYDEAAWYKYSVSPGSLGPAIIIGHVDSAANGPSVFFELGRLRQGDDILVRRADGRVASFVVTGVGSYPKDEFPTDLVYGDTDHAALRLITCGGPFDAAGGHYRDNIVVFAALADAVPADSYEAKFT